LLKRWRKFSAASAWPAPLPSDGPVMRITAPPVSSVFADGNCATTAARRLLAEAAALSGLLGVSEEQPTTLREIPKLTTLTAVLRTHCNLMKASYG
jgi:hypothetical protein